jgi:post-segregation antitoxin (ccd killing protein)
MNEKTAKLASISVKLTISPDAAEYLKNLDDRSLWISELAEKAIALQLDQSTPQSRWKEKTGFEKSDRRRGYRAGYTAAQRGKAEPPEDLPSDEWGNGYLKGFEAVKKNS